MVSSSIGIPLGSEFSKLIFKASNNLQDAVDSARQFVSKVMINKYKTITSVRNTRVRKESERLEEGMEG